MTPDALRTQSPQATALRVPPESYAAVFERDPVGKAILEDLVARFHDCPIGMDDANTHKTARQLGNREVVQFILRRIGQVNEAPQE